MLSSTNTVIGSNESFAFLNDISGYQIYNDNQNTIHMKSDNVIYGLRAQKLLGVAGIKRWAMIEGPFWRVGEEGCQGDWGVCRSIRACLPSYQLKECKSLVFRRFTGVE